MAKKTLPEIPKKKKEKTEIEWFHVKVTKDLVKIIPLPVGLTPDEKEGVRKAKIFQTLHIEEIKAQEQKPEIKNNIPAVVSKELGIDFIPYDNDINLIS